MSQPYTAKELAEFVKRQERSLAEMEEWRLMKYRRNEIIKRAALAGFSGHEISNLMGLGGSATVYDAMRSMGLESLIGKRRKGKSAMSVAFAIMRGGDA